MSALDYCPQCNRTFVLVSRAPMLRDAAWAKLANKDEDLCAECMFDRARARSVALTLADLKPCPFNMWHRPLSWFDLFSRDETPEVIDLWLKEIEMFNQTAR